MLSTPTSSAVNVTAKIGKEMAGPVGGKGPARVPQAIEATPPRHDGSVVPKPEPAQPPPMAGTGGGDGLTDGAMALVRQTAMSWATPICTLALVFTGLQGLVPFQASASIS